MPPIRNTVSKQQIQSGNYSTHVNSAKYFAIPAECVARGCITTRLGHNVQSSQMKHSRVELQIQVVAPLAAIATLCLVKVLCIGSFCNDMSKNGSAIANSVHAAASYLFSCSAPSKYPIHSGRQDDLELLMKIKYHT